MTGADAARRLRRLFSGAAAAVIPIAIGFSLAFMMSGSEPVERVRNIVFDQFQRWAPRPWSPDLPVRVVDVDDASLAKLGQWPWPRQRLADLTRKLGEAGAAVVAFDALLSEPDRLAPGTILSALPDLPERRALAEALRSAGALDADPLEAAFRDTPVVTALALTSQDTNERAPMKTRFVALGDDPAPLVPGFASMILPLPNLREAATGLGAINYLPDLDLTLRKVPLVLAVRDPKGGAPTLVPSFVTEALRVAFRTDTPLIKATNASGETSFGGHAAIVAVKIGAAEIPTEPDGSVRIRFAGSQPGRRLPAWKVLAGEIPPDEIDGRIMLIGSSAAGLLDLRSTPLDAAVAGVDVHAEAIEHALTGGRLARPDWAPGAEAWAIVLGGLLIAFAARRLRPAWAAGAALALIGGGAAGAWFAFSRADLLFDPLIPGASWAAAYVAATVGIYRRTEREKRFVRAAFQHYLSPAVVERLASDPSQLKLGGETREVSILFSDVRDFTTRSETLSAEGVVRFLNALHTPTTGAVLAHGGTIDKYIGDGLMAFWNAPLEVRDHANCACAAALAMLEAIPAVDAAMRAQAEAEGRPHVPVRIGIGLNVGSVFVGNMGSEQRFDYSIVGDPVNVAARLEAATKTTGASILVSEAMAAAATDFAFVPLGAIDLKGKTSATRVFALHARKGDEEPHFDAYLEAHAAALAAVGRGDADAVEKIALAQAHPAGARYSAFYDRLRDPGSAPAASEPGKRPGGS